MRGTDTGCTRSCTCNAACFSAHLVLLQVPALDHLVQAAGEHVGVARADRQPRDLLNVARQRQLELTAGGVPDLDGAIRRARGKPLVAGVECHGPHPAAVQGGPLVARELSSGHAHCSSACSWSKHGGWDWQLQSMAGAHPRWPEMTRYMRHGACHAGRGHLLGSRRAIAAEGVYSFCLSGKVAAG